MYTPYTNKYIAFIHVYLFYVIKGVKKIITCKQIYERLRNKENIIQISLKKYF